MRSRYAKLNRHESQRLFIYAKWALVVEAVTVLGLLLARGAS